MPLQQGEVEGYDFNRSVVELPTADLNFSLLARARGAGERAAGI